MSSAATLSHVPNQDLAEVVGNLASTKGWSNEELARQAGLSTKTISRVLSGKTAEPRRPTIQALAAALDVDEAVLAPRAAYSPNPTQLDRIERMLTELLAVVAPTRPEGAADDKPIPGPPDGLLHRDADPSPTDGKPGQQDSLEEHDDQRRTAA
jgi:transcriptional regulator with XRE-family HTH domain